MPRGFQKGNKLAEGIGRKGYELERKQLELMRELVNKDLKLVKKFYEGKATEADFKKLAALQGRVSKYLDKLHSQKTDITSGGEQIKQIPIYAGKSVESISGYNSNEENISVETED